MERLRINELKLGLEKCNRKLDWAKSKYTSFRWENYIFILFLESLCFQVSINDAWTESNQIISLPTTIFHKLA